MISKKINERVRCDFSPGCCASILRNDKQTHNIQQPSRVYYIILLLQLRTLMINDYSDDGLAFMWKKIYLIGIV